MNDTKHIEFQDIENGRAFRAEHDGQWYSRIDTRTAKCMTGPEIGSVVDFTPTEAVQV